MRYLFAALLALVLGLCSCDMFKDTADTTQAGGEGAVGIADKMSEGTLKDADMDSGESASDDSSESGDE
ncbi:MAG: hypothetical protein H7A35_12480 [Planctomycetales bacterium]|nr:hypothetical protein [bacterium]UNM07668.1 MAG: hypothetical protein H7A35_12480 [Planctomycetales bacterium]